MPDSVRCRDNCPVDFSAQVIVENWINWPTFIYLRSVVHNVGMGNVRLPKEACVQAD